MMKKLLCAYVLFFLILPSAASAALIVKPGNNLGLIAYWPFNDGAGTVADDVSGRKAHGVFQNTPDWTDGRIGKALDFNSDGDGVITTFTDSPVTSTITMWIYPRTAGEGNAGAVVSRSNMYTLATCSQDATLCPGTDNTFSFNYPLWEGSRGLWLTPSNSVRMNEWQHVAIVYDNSSTSITPIIYIDGVRIAVSTSSAPSSPKGVEGYNIKIGDSGENFDGKIDEVRVYSRLLSASEVGALYRSGAARMGGSAVLTNGASLSRGLVGHWTFDGADVTTSVLDKSGAGNHAGFSGAPTSTAKVAGKIGQAFKFDGVDDIVRAPDSASLDISGTVSIAFWMNAAAHNQFDDFTYVVAKRDEYNGPDTFSVEMHPSLGGTNRMYFWWSSGAPFVGYISDSAHEYRLNTWDHWVVVRDAANQTVQMYRNGEDAGATLYENTFASADATVDAFAIGGAIFDTIHSFNGKLDDVRIYNRALTAAEAKQLASLGTNAVGASSASLTAGGLNSGLAGHWTFDGADITTNAVLDRSGNGNHGGFFGGSTSTAKRIGKLGQALRFNGSTTYVNVGTSTSLNITGAITLSAWVKFSSIVCSSGCDIVANYNSGGTTGQYELSMFNGEIGYSTAFGGSFPGGTTNTTPITETNRWYHVAVTRNATGDRTADTVTIYVDGVAQSLAPGFTTDTPPSSGFGRTAIGRDGDVVDPSLHFPGDIDDVRIYRRELTASEIRQLYNIGR